MINHVVKLLLDNNLIDRTILQTLVVDFLFDNLEFNKRILLIEYILNIKEDNEFINLIRLLIEKLTIENSDNSRCIIISKVSEFKDYTIYIFRNNKDNIEMTLGEYEDYNDFDDVIKSKKIDQKKLNSILCFLELNKKVTKFFDIDSKIKTEKNKGARCNQAGKSNSEKVFFEMGLDKDTIDIFKKLKQNIYCYIQEFYFRYFNFINKDDKIWFLNLEDKLINEL